MWRLPCPRSRFFLAVTVLVLAVPSMSVREAGSTLSSSLATVSGTLNPGDSSDFSFTIPKDLDDSLVHVTVNAVDPDLDRLSIVIDTEGWSTLDIQGDWWDSVGSLTAGGHTLTATSSPDAANPLTFTVEFYEIPTPPLTIQGTFPAQPYNLFAYVDVSVTAPGSYQISANAQTGNFAILIEGYDEIDVVGSTQRTLEFTESRVYMVTVQADVLGTGEAVAWSMTITPPGGNRTTGTTTTTTQQASSTSETTSSIVTTLTTESSVSETTSSVVSTSTMAVTTSTTSVAQVVTSEEPRAIHGVPCPVAAAFGSAMAPEVVYIRYVRDELIGSTPTGKTLVHAFNLFYYSWAPFLARVIEGSDLLRAVFRVLLLPLTGIIHLTALAFTALASMTGDRDLASILAFLAAASMTAGVYVALPAIATVNLERKIRDLVEIVS
jgi:hypothetical protein